MLYMYMLYVCVKVAQSCPTLCNPLDYTVHGILQARILEWVAFPFCRRSSWPRDWTQVSHIAGRFFTSWATREAQIESTTSQFCIFLVINIKTLTYKLCLPTDADLITSVPLTASCLLWTRQKLSTLPLVTTSHFETVWNAHQDDC